MPKSLIIKECVRCGFVPDIKDGDFIYPVNREETLWNVVCYEVGGGCGMTLLL